MEPPHGQRRTVLGIPLQAQPVPTVDDMVSSLLGSQPRRDPLPFLLLLLHLLCLVCLFPGLRCQRRLRGGGSRAPRREIREKALLVVRCRHPVNGRGVAGTKPAQPGLCAVPWSLGGLQAGRGTGKHAERKASMGRAGNTRGGLGIEHGVLEDIDYGRCQESRYVCSCLACACSRYITKPTSRPLSSGGAAPCFNCTPPVVSATLYKPQPWPSTLWPIYLQVAQGRHLFPANIIALPRQNGVKSASRSPMPCSSSSGSKHSTRRCHVKKAAQSISRRLPTHASRFPQMRLCTLQARKSST
jgi:hypothetical protein